MTRVTYRPNLIVRRLPARLSFSLSKLARGTHTLRIRAVFHESIDGHARTVVKTLTHRFSVCAS